jgi:o-succinylbenzoate synthase
MSLIVGARWQRLTWPLFPWGSPAAGAEVPGLRHSLIVALRDEQGRVGLGEAAPVPGFGDDSVSAAEVEVRRFGDQIQLRTVVVTPETLVDQDIGALRSAAARFAVETAATDLLAQQRGVPLARVLVPSPAARVTINAVVSTPAEAGDAWAAGIQTFKVKLGRAGQDDAQVIAAIRQAVPQARLRGDANQLWPQHEVHHRLGELARFRLDYVEEPCVDAWQLLGRDSAIAVALDESLSGHPMSEIGRWLAAGPSVLGALILKATPLGGLSAALKLAAAARAHGVKAIVTHGLEGPVATAAAAELALAVGGEDAAGLAHHASLRAWPRNPVAQLVGAQVIASSRPGLGLDAGALWSEVEELCAAPLEPQA